MPSGIKSAGENLRGTAGAPITAARYILNIAAQGVPPGAAGESPRKNSPWARYAGNDTWLFSADNIENFDRAA